MIQDMVITRESNPVISFDGSLFDGDPEFLAEIVNLFLATYPDLLSDIDGAVLRQDADALRRAAHALKGAVANFGAKPVVEQATTIETIGKCGDFAAARVAFTRVRAFSPSLRARGSKTRETSSQQPLHAIPTGSPLLRYGGFAARKGADARLLAGMSDLGLHHEFAKVGTMRRGGRYPITCENVPAARTRAFSIAASGTSGNWVSASRPRMRTPCAGPRTR
jgi:HPt (histidine-containing phosphotransfer) domain-containing protein